MTYLLGETPIYLLAVGVLGASIAWMIHELLRDSNEYESPNLIIPAGVELKKELTVSPEKLEDNFHTMIAERVEKISRLEDRIAELESLPEQLKICESIKTSAENQLDQRTASFKKQVESFQSRIRELEPMKQLAEDRLLSLTQLKDTLDSFRVEKAKEIKSLKQNIARLGPLQEKLKEEKMNRHRLEESLEQFLEKKTEQFPLKEQLKQMEKIRQSEKEEFASSYQELKTARKKDHEFFQAQIQEIQLLKTKLQKWVSEIAGLQSKLKNAGSFSKK